MVRRSTSVRPSRRHVGLSADRGILGVVPAGGSLGPDRLRQSWTRSTPCSSTACSTWCLAARGDRCGDGEDRRSERGDRAGPPPRPARVAVSARRVCGRPSCALRVAQLPPKAGIGAELLLRSSLAPELSPGLTDRPGAVIVADARAGATPRAWRGTSTVGSTTGPMPGPRPGDGAGSGAAPAIESLLALCPPGSGKRLRLHARAR